MTCLSIPPSYTFAGVSGGGVPYSHCCLPSPPPLSSSQARVPTHGFPGLWGCPPNECPTFLESATPPECRDKIDKCFEWHPLVCMNRLTIRSSCWPWKVCMAWHLDIWQSCLCRTGHGWPPPIQHLRRNWLCPRPSLTHGDRASVEQSALPPAPLWFSGHIQGWSENKRELNRATTRTFMTVKHFDQTCRTENSL